MTEEERNRFLKIQKKIVFLVDQYLNSADLAGAKQVLEQLPLVAGSLPHEGMLDKQGAALFHLFRIMDEEIKRNEVITLRSFRNVAVVYDAWISFHNYLRDMEFGIEKNPVDRLRQLMAQYAMSMTALLYMVRLYAYDSEMLGKKVMALLNGEVSGESSRSALGFTRPEGTFSKKSGTVAFVVCTNDDAALQRCAEYVAKLEIPEGYEVFFCPVYEAKSMAAGYNEAMQSIVADYKIYIHQDVLCINPYILLELIPFFEEHPDVGMVGVAGAKDVDPSGIWWNAHHKFYNMILDNLIRCENDSLMDPSCYDHDTWQEVSVLDGAFLATSVDIKWREDLFDGWHFYDVSQCMEMKKAGKRLGILRPNSGAWIIHEENTGNLLGEEYDKYRKKFTEEYHNLYE